MKQANEERELTRLLNEAGSELTEHVAALRERGPSPLELGSLASSLAARGIGIMPSAPSATPRAWKKWAAGGGGGAVAVALWLALAPRGVGRSTAPGAHTAKTLHEQAAARSSAAPLVSASQSPRAFASVLEENSVALPSAVPAPLPLPATPAPDAPPLASNHRATKPLTSGAPASESRTLHVSEANQPPGEAATRPTELELLRDARLALRSSPAATLGFVDRHAQLYPQGKLTQERELIAISALVAMGRRTAALLRAASFERSFPGSAYRKQVEELLR